MPAKKSEPRTVTLTFAVDPEWVKFCTGETDLFGYSYCGYWLRGVERVNGRGWLVWESDEKSTWGEEPNRKEALRAWRKGESLPTGWYRLDADAATKAFGEGVKRFGADWYDGPNSDADAYDYVIQQALLGEQRYA